MVFEEIQEGLGVVPPLKTVRAVRIQRFEETTANPALMDKDLIARILNLKLTSPET